MYQTGKIMPTSIFVRGSNANSIVIDDYQSFSLKISTHTTGEHLWEQLCNNPSWGVSVNVLEFIILIQLLQFTNTNANFSIRIQTIFYQ